MTIISAWTCGLSLQMKGVHARRCGTDDGPGVHAIASTQTLPFDPTNPEESNEVKEPVKAKGGRPRSHTAAIIYAEQLRAALS